MLYLPHLCIPSAEYNAGHLINKYWMNDCVSNLPPPTLGTERALPRGTSHRDLAGTCPFHSAPGSQAAKPEGKQKGYSLLAQCLLSVYRWGQPWEHTAVELKDLVSVLVKLTKGRKIPPWATKSIITYSNKNCGGRNRMPWEKIARREGRAL